MSVYVRQVPIYVQGSHMPNDHRLAFPMSAIPVGLGATIAKERALLNWTQQRLADEAGLKRETIVRLEAGARRPSGDTVFRLEVALDLEPGTLVPKWPEWRPIGSMTHGARSRERRRELGLSLVSVAKAAGVSVATLSRFERETHVCQSIATYNRVEGMSEVVGLKKKRFARALGFASVAEHERYCVTSD